MSDDLTAVTEKLRRLTPHYQGILDVLSPGTTEITGSLIVQALLNETWESDIDIVTTDKTFCSLPFGKWLTCVGYTERYKDIPGLFNVINGEINGNGGRSVKIDIIQVENIQNHIAMYDFDFCKVRFDGSEIHISNYDAIESKSCSVTRKSNRFHNLNERVAKYRKRGFKITVFTENGVEEDIKDTSGFEETFESIEEVK